MLHVMELVKLQMSIVLYLKVCVEERLHWRQRCLQLPLGTDSDKGQQTL